MVAPLMHMCIYMKPLSYTWQCMPIQSVLVTPSPQGSSFQDTPGNAMPQYLEVHAQTLLGFRCRIRVI